MDTTQQPADNSKSTRNPVISSGRDTRKEGARNDETPITENVTILVGSVLFIGAAVIANIMQSASIRNPIGKFFASISGLAFVLLFPCWIMSSPQFVRTKKVALIVRLIPIAYLMICVALMFAFS